MPLVTVVRVATSAPKFPNPGFEFGDYPVEWLLKNRRFTGDVALAPRRRPQITLHGKLRRPKKNAAGELVYFFPGQRISYPRLVGQLRSNQDIVVLEADIEEWFPERFSGFGRWGIVGLDIASVPDDAYDHITFQITDADLWFGAPPLEGIRWPKPSDTDKTYSATLRLSANRTWRDTRNGFTLDFHYPHTYSLDPYRFQLAFAPTFDVRSRHPIGLHEWSRQWIAPLVDLASIATKRPQTLSWLNVHRGTDRNRRTGTVFSWGIHQAPYQAHYDDEWRQRPERRPLFTISSLGGTPMQLVKRWRSLQASDDPFGELYRSAIFDSELPARGRFLHLVQALEAHHSYSTHKLDERDQKAFVKRRLQVIGAAEAAGLSPANVRTLKREWGTRKTDSLDRRLLALLSQLPPGLRATLEANPALEPIRHAIISDPDLNASTLQSQLRVLRNQLSHGSKNYADHELRPWVELAETVCQARVLMLLGFSPPEIENALARA